MSQGRYYNQKKLDKKYLKAIGLDRSQRKLVMHDMTSQGQHFRMLGATGVNPVINPAPTVNNYGPVFGANTTFSANAPMLFSGNFTNVSNNSSSSNNGLSVPNGTKESALSNYQVKKLNDRKM